MAYQIEWEPRGLYRLFTDQINGNEILNSNLSLHGDARFDDIKYVLNDFTKIDTFHISEEDVQAIACIDNVAAISKPVLKIAIVVTLHTLLEWALMYCEKMQGSPYDCRIFETLDDARAWLTP